MMNADEVLRSLAALGAVGSAATIGTAVIASKSNKGKSRAEAADLLVGAAERIGKMNINLDEENHRLRAAIHEIHAALVVTTDLELAQAVLVIIRDLYESERDK